MSDDWKVGDLAVCVEANWRDQHDPSFNGIGPKVGDICCVDEIHFGFFVELGFREWPEAFFNAAQFRRLLPDEPTACEEEFQILLKLSKQRVKA